MKRAKKNQAVQLEREGGNNYVNAKKNKIQKANERAESW